MEQLDKARLSYDDCLDRAYRPPDARSGWDAAMESIRREAAQLLGVSLDPK